MTDQAERRVKRALLARGRWVVLGIPFGGALGWIAGSWTTCGRGCGPDWNAVEAIGTWVGGLGTITAVYWAAATYRREERLRRESVEREDRLRREDLARAEALRREDIEREEALRREDLEREEAQRLQAEERAKLSEAQQMELFTAEANEVVLRAQIGGGTDKYVDELRFVLLNRANTTSIYKAHCEVDDWPGLPPLHELPAGRTHIWDYRTKATNPNLPVAVEYSRRGEWEAEMLERATVTWTMNDLRWTRTGSGPVELVS